MKFNRTKNATRNILFSLGQRLYSLIAPFFVRTLFIYTLGTQYLGLNGLFVSVLQVLNLTELGVGTAMVYSMYKPLAEDDIPTVCALMRLYKIYYRIIGAAVLVLGLAVVPFLPVIVKDELPPEVNMYALYLLNLASTVVTYWLFAYKNCIIAATQRTDIEAKITWGINTLTYLAQIAVLLWAPNYYWYIGVGIVTAILSNLVTARVAGRLFPQFQAVGTLSKEKVQAINRRVRDLFTSKVGKVVIYSVDTIVISAFLGLTVLAKYQNYLFIMNAVVGCIGVVYKSMCAIIGNSLVTETPQRNYKMFRIFLLLIAWVSGVCTTCLLCLYQPFMHLWVGPELMLDFGTVICFCLYFFAFEINRVFNLYKDASGMWHSDRFRPLVISLLNLGLNLLTVQMFGLYGILLSTVVPILFLSYPWLSVTLCREVFVPRQVKGILARVALYFVATAIAAAATYGVCALIVLPPVPTLIVRTALCAVIPQAVLFLMLVKTGDFKDTAGFVNEKFLKGRSRLLHRLASRS